MNVKIGCNKLSGAPVKSRYRLRVPVKFTGNPPKPLNYNITSYTKRGLKMKFIFD